MIRDLNLNYINEFEAGCLYPKARNYVKLHRYMVIVAEDPATSDLVPTYASPAAPGASGAKAASKDHR